MYSNNVRFYHYRNIYTRKKKLYKPLIICLQIMMKEINWHYSIIWIRSSMFVTPALWHYSDTIICLLLLLFGYSDTIICLYDNRIRYKIYNLEHLLLVDEKYIMLVKVGAWIVVWTDVLSTIKKRRDKVEEYY